MAHKEYPSILINEDTWELIRIVFLSHVVHVITTRQYLTIITQQGGRTIAAQYHHADAVAVTTI